MPTKPVSPELMSPGGKSGGKHWTKAEVEARANAAGGLKRSKPVSLTCPKWLTKKGKQIWRQVIKDTAGLDLFDNLDRHTLAVYCDAVAKYQTLADKGDTESGEEGKQPLSDEEVKALQAWARLIAGLADKLGLTPGARARLIKKKAEEPADLFADEFD